MNEIGKNLKALRKEAGLSLRALGEKVGISHNTLATYEREEVIPTVLNALKICDFFNVQVEYLVYGKVTITDFNDKALLRIFRDIDEFDEDDRGIAKRFLQKLVRNVKEKKQIIEEAKDE